MKSIPNLVFLAGSNGARNVTVASLLADCLKTPPPGGFDYAAMRARLRVEAVLEKAEPGGTIELEDADDATARAAVAATKWTVMDKHIIQFAELFGA